MENARPGDGDRAPAYPPARRRSPIWAAWITGSLLGLFVFSISLATIDRPGMTVDEPPNVLYGKKLYWTWTNEPTAFTTAAGIDRLWRAGHEHPPLTRFLLGLCHGLLDLEPADPNALFPVLARPASAIALSLLVLLCTRAGWHIGGPAAGIVAGLTVPLMPRLFAHGAIASPEVLTAAFFLLALLVTGWAFRCEAKAAGWKRALRANIAGIALGLALLAKLSNILLVLIVPLAVLWQRQGRWANACWLFVWGLTGLITLIVGWPWLWPVDLPGYAPGWGGTLQRLAQYFAFSIDRSTIYVWYFGAQYPNATSGVPWHFAWVYFLVTVPVGLQAMGLVVGLPACWRRRNASLLVRLLLSSIAVILLFFSLPIDRYDGERLFLMVFAPWAIVIGVGAACVARGLIPYLSRRVTYGVLALFLLVQSVGLWKYLPFGLSYYSAAVGGLRGAHALGLEPTYWGDSLTADLLNQFASAAEAGDCAGLLPTLHPIHPQFLQTPIMRAKRLKVVAGDQMLKDQCQWALVFHRTGYLRDPLPAAVMKEGTVVAEISREGVWLARVYRLPNGFSERTLTQQTDKPDAATGK